MLLPISILKLKVNLGMQRHQLMPLWLFDEIGPGSQSTLASILTLSTTQSIPIIFFSLSAGI